MEENRTILIVDDEQETLKGYEQFLTGGSPGSNRKSSRRSQDTQGEPAKSASDGFRLLTAPSGEKAVELFKQELSEGRRIAAGFFDVKLEGGMDGLATIQAIKTLDKDIHCVVVTAYHDRTVDEINVLFGEEFKDQWDYLNKPFNQGEIIQKARQMVAAWNRKIKLREVSGQLVRSERMAAIGQIARGVGHEFGNILLRIVGKTDLALMEKDVQKIHDHLKVVMQAAERAGVIVRNLQSFSKAEPLMIMGSIVAPLEEALSLVNHELTKASVKVVKHLNPVASVRLDAGGLGQVYLNLMINAAHAMQGTGGTLTLTSEDALGSDGRPGVCVHIEDTGTGIKPEVLPRIFDYAFTTKGDKGSGLGLAVSKEIVEAHRGQLTVTSVLGKGTKFTIWVPK